MGLLTKIGDGVVDTMEGLIRRMASLSKPSVLPKAERIWHETRVWLGGGDMLRRSRVVVVARSEGMLVHHNATLLRDTLPQ